MAWTDVDSSMIHSYDYDADMQALHVKFHSGRVASLQKVPPDIASQFAAAESKGKFFHTRLRDQYQVL